VTPADPSGNAYATSLAATGVANLQTASYRDSLVTVQNSATSAAPAAGTAVATVTPATAGIWEVSGTVAISGTTVVAADSHNMQLKQGSTVKLTAIPYPLTGTTGSTAVAPFGPVLLSLDGATACTVNAAGNATASSVYAASIVARRAG
jgi:hypothetical protein